MMRAPIPATPPLLAVLSLKKVNYLIFLRFSIATVAIVGDSLR